MTIRVCQQRNGCPGSPLRSVLYRRLESLGSALSGASQRLPVDRTRRPIECAHFDIRSA